MPMLAGDGRARSPLTCTGHKGDDGTADALVVPGINSQCVCHPGIEVCQLYRLGLSLNRDSFFRMVAWGTETSVSLGPGMRSWRGSASFLPPLEGRSLGRGQGPQGQAILQTGRSPGSSNASLPHSADSYKMALRQGILSPLLGFSFLTTAYTLKISDLLLRRVRGPGSISPCGKFRSECWVPGV